MMSRPKVLILEYDLDLLLDLEHALETGGFDTTVGWQVDAFYHLLGKREFDVLVLGHHPPDIDALTVLRSLEAKQTHVLVLDNPTRSRSEHARFQELGASMVLPRTASDVPTVVRGMLTSREEGAVITPEA